MPTEDRAAGSAKVYASESPCPSNPLEVEP
jgi:hypothetical protein